MKSGAHHPTMGMGSWALRVTCLNCEGTNYVENSLKMDYAVHKISDWCRCILNSSFTLRL